VPVGRVDSIVAMAPGDSGVERTPAVGTRLDPESAEWCRVLGGTGPRREEALVQLHGMLVRIEVVAQELPSIVTLAKLLEVKFKWGISLAALIRHLHANGVITDQRKKTLYSQLYTRRNPETGRSFGATEPGWDRRGPERPRLISAWLERIVGSVAPEAIASISGIFPADILGSVLNEQREAPARPGASPVIGQQHGARKVVYLRDRLPQLTSDADIAQQLEIR
jgi:hypothetical protein